MFHAIMSQNVTGTIIQDQLLHCKVYQLDEVPVLGVYLDYTGVDEMLDGLNLHVEIKPLDADPVTVPIFHVVFPDRLK